MGSGLAKGTSLRQRVVWGLREVSQGDDVMDPASPTYHPGPPRSPKHPRTLPLLNSRTSPPPTTILARLDHQSTPGPFLS